MMYELYLLPDGTWQGLDPHGTVLLSQVHDTDDCAGHLCDVHGRRGPGPYDTSRLFWQFYSDGPVTEAFTSGRMLMLCEHGVLHPTPAQVEYSLEMEHAHALVRALQHDCDGCCARAW